MRLEFETSLGNIVRACLEEGRKGREKAAFCPSVCLSQMYAALFAPRGCTKVVLLFILECVLRMSESWEGCWCLDGTGDFIFFLGN